MGIEDSVSIEKDTRSLSGSRNLENRPDRNSELFGLKYSELREGMYCFRFVPKVWREKVKQEERSGATVGKQQELVAEEMSAKELIFDADATKASKVADFIESLAYNSALPMEEIRKAAEENLNIISSSENGVVAAERYLGSHS